MKFALDRHPFFWLTQVIGARDRELAQGLKDFGLRVPEWRALAALYSRRGCTTSQLADLATIDRTTLTRTVDRMQEAGWLSRAAGQTILVIDKYVERLVALADRHTIIERGKVAWQGSSAELDADRGLWHRYLGV